MIETYFDILLFFFVIPLTVVGLLWWALWQTVEYQYRKELKRRAKQIKTYGWSNEYQKHRRNQ
jgi:hypothetical protein